MRAVTNSEKETFDWGRTYARGLKGGEIIGLCGRLGAGKTVLAKGLAAGLGVKGPVNSPTFVVLKSYPARRRRIRRLVHIDAYRLEKTSALQSLGLLDQAGQNDTVAVIEWADKIKKILPPETIFIELCWQDEKKRRLIVLD